MPIQCSSEDKLPLNEFRDISTLFISVTLRTEQVGEFCQNMPAYLLTEYNDAY